MFRVHLDFIFWSFLEIGTRKRNLISYRLLFVTALRKCLINLFLLCICFTLWALFEKV